MVECPGMIFDDSLLLLGLRAAYDLMWGFVQEASTLMSAATAGMGDSPLLECAMGERYGEFQTSRDQGDMGSKARDRPRIQAK